MAPFGPAGADQRVQFVDEEDDVLGPADFVHDRLDALLELPAVLGAGDHHRQIEHDDPAVVQQFRHGAGDDHLGQPLDDGRLAHARLAQKNRVVLLPPAEDLDDPFDLVLSTDDRVKLPFAGQFGQIATEAVQRRGLALAVLALFFLCLGFFAFHTSSQKIENLFPNFFQLQTQIHQYLGRHAIVLAQQAEQKMFRSYVIVIQVPGFLDGVFDDFLGPGRLGQLAHRDHVRAALDQFFDFQADLAQVDVQVLQNVGADAAAFLDQTQQDVLGADVFVIEALGFLVGQGHDFAGAVGKSFKHVHLLVGRQG